MIAYAPLMVVPVKLRRRNPVAYGMVGGHAVGMGVLNMIADRVAGGATVETRPTGRRWCP
jgi:hypothetical protein